MRGGGGTLSRAGLGSGREREQHITPKLCRSVALSLCLSYTRTNAKTHTRTRTHTHIYTDNLLALAGLGAGGPEAIETAAIAVWHRHPVVVLAVVGILERLALEWPGIWLRVQGWGYSGWRCTAIWERLALRIMV